MSNAEHIARELGGNKAKRSGDGWSTLCPCHEDRTPSLTVTDADGGDVVVHCFAGCDWQQIKETLRARGLLPEFEPTPQRCHETPRRSAPDTPPPWERPIAARYDYCDAYGDVLYRKVRFGDTHDPKASFCAPDDAGKWHWKTLDRERVLYRLPDLISNSSGTVIICEGEKDADTLAAAGLIATTLRDGASSDPHKTDLAPLSGRRVVVVGDNDNPGQRYAENVARAVHNIAKDVRIVHLPVEGKGEDVTDWFDSYGGTGGQFKALCQRTDVYHPPADTGTQMESDQGKPGTDHLNWPVPTDVLATTRPPEIDIDMLPVPLQSITAEHAELIGCDPAVIGITALVCAASCIDDAIKVQPKRHDQTWTESARLWGAILGDPSTKKTPGMSKAMRPIKRIDKAWMQSSASSIAAWEERKEEYDAEAKAARKRGEHPTVHEPGERPPKRRLLLEDTTVEAMAQIMSDNPRGVMVHHDELTQWFGSMDAYSGNKSGGSKDRGYWLQAYNGGYMQVDRVLRGNQVVENFSASIIGGIQPGPMRKIAKTLGADGLLQRFMVIVARPCGRGVDRTADKGILDNYTEVMEQMASIKSDGSVIRYTEEAHTHREHIEDLEHRLIRAFTSDHIRAWIGKWSGLFSRLALTYHVMECAAARVHPENESINERTAARVRSLMESFLLQHAIYFYTDVVDAADQNMHAKEIAGMILAQRWQSFSKRDLQKTWHRFRGLDYYDVMSALDTLEVAGWITPDRSDLDRRRQPRTWDVNPFVHEMYETHAEAERIRRQEAREVLSGYTGAPKTE